MSKSREWLNSLKVALAKESFNEIENITAQKVEFSTSNELNEAKYLLKEALKLSLKERSEIELKLHKIEKNINKTKATLSTPFHKIDRSF